MDRKIFSGADISSQMWAAIFDIARKDREEEEPVEMKAEKVSDNLLKTGESVNK